MKKIFTGLFLLSLASANAQENKNKFVVSANLAVSYQSPYPLSLGGFNIGYFFTDHFAIGATGNYYNSERSYSREDQLDFRSSNKDKQSNSYAGVFARYNFSPKNKFAFFLSLNNSFTWQKYKYENNSTFNGIDYSNTSASSMKGYTISLTPGIIYFIHPKFSAEAILGSINYSTRVYKDPYYVNGNYVEATTKYSGLSASFFTSGFNLGLSYYFGRKNKNAEQ